MEAYKIADPKVTTRNPPFSLSLYEMMDVSGTHYGNFVVCVKSLCYKPHGDEEQRPRDYVSLKLCGLAPAHDRIDLRPI